MIAHEVGHHVQNLIGIAQGATRRSSAAPRRKPTRCRCAWSCRPIASPASGRNTPAQRKQLLEPGDVEEALNAAARDRRRPLQKQSQGRVVPESFTHGTSAQRVRWLRGPRRSGAMNACDTFGAAAL